MFIFNDCLGLAGLEVDDADKEGDLIVGIQMAPQHFCQFLCIAVDLDGTGLALKGRQRIEVLLIGVDEMTHTGLGIVVFVEETLVAVGVAVQTLEDGQNIAAVLCQYTRDSGGVVGGIGLEAAGTESFDIALAGQQAVADGIGLVTVSDDGIAVQLADGM